MHFLLLKQAVEKSESAQKGNLFPDFLKLIPLFLYCHINVMCLLWILLGCLHWNGLQTCVMKNWVNAFILLDSTANCNKNLKEVRDGWGYKHHKVTPGHSILWDLVVECFATKIHLGMCFLWLCWCCFSVYLRSRISSSHL